MLKEFLLTQIIPEVLFLILSVLVGIITYFVKKFYLAHKDFLDYQKQQLIQKIGIDKYNHDLDVAKGLVMAIEQESKTFDWHGTVKHAKATELISQKTRLSSEEIYNVIMATVAELNKNKPKTVQ